MANNDHQEPDRTLTLANAVAPTPAHPYRRGAPNVVMVLLDDCGFGQLGCYGSPIDTPNIDRLADDGLRFTNFHTTAICSPTRASLLTGRNHHRVGMGMLPDLPMPFEGYTGVIPPSAGSLPAIVGDAGWVTWATGKWHLCPRDHRGPSGPFHTWPTGLGFDRYYGFLSGEDSQYTPDLVRDQSFVDAPRSPEDGYHFTEDMADEAIGNIRSHLLHQPDRPFLLYWATGAVHSPQQAPDDWIDRYAGSFDNGWRAYAESTLERQKSMGVVPPHVELPPLPDFISDWETLSTDQQRLFARFQEVFAGYLSHTDAQIGRIIDELERLGVLDNTIVMVLSDNGASSSGGPLGSTNHMAEYNQSHETLSQIQSEIETAGGHRGYNQYPWGWASAGNTPLKRWKRYTFEGGVRDPLIVRWPHATKDPGGLRHQYCHAVDLLPTVLDLADVEWPHVLNGIEQSSLDGVSLKPAIEDASSAELRDTQYYECWGSRAIYHKGWKAVSDHVIQTNENERTLIEGSADFEKDQWALYRSDVDFTETNDLAEAEPEMLQELIALWQREAEQNNVLPIDDGIMHRLRHVHMPYAGTRRRYDLQAGQRLSATSGPLLFGGLTVAAELTRKVGNHEGVLVEQGNWIAGWSWVLLDDALTLFVAAPGAGHHSVRVERPEHAKVLGLAVTSKQDGSTEVTMRADGAKIGTGSIAAAFPRVMTTGNAWLCAGYGTPFPVSDAYRPPYRLGILDRVVVDDGTPEIPAFEELLEEFMRHQ